MSKRKLGNLLKRKLSSIARLFDGFKELGDSKKDEFFQSQFKDFSRLGGELIVMKMGS